MGADPPFIRQRLGQSSTISECKSTWARSAAEHTEIGLRLLKLRASPTFIGSDPPGRSVIAPQHDPFDRGSPSDSAIRSRYIRPPPAVQ